MLRRGILLGASAVALSSMAAGGVVAATRAGDDGALQKTRSSADQAVEHRVDALLRKMNVDEKLQQVTLLSDGQINQDPSQATKGVGGVFSLTDAAKIDKYQHMAVEGSRLHIPILFAFDT